MKTRKTNDTRQIQSGGTCGSGWFRNRSNKEKLLNNAYNSGDISNDVLQLIGIALPKKAGGLECEDYRTIGRMSYTHNTVTCEKSKT